MKKMEFDIYRKHEHEWAWETNDLTNHIKLSRQNSTVTFHPKHSSGTAVVRGNKPFVKGRHYFWEIKLMTEPYGTDVMIGVGTKKVNLNSSIVGYCSLLGKDKESWGLSYFGVLQHNGEKKNYGPRLVKGTTIGVHLDTWRGTLHYFIDNKPFGMAFSGLRDLELYPMVCSTAAKSIIKVTRCMSEPVSLQMECLSALKPTEKVYLETTFPFLHHLCRSVFADILNKHFNKDEDLYSTDDESR